VKAQHAYHHNVTRSAVIKIVAKDRIDFISLLRNTTRTHDYENQNYAILTTQHLPKE